MALRGLTPALETFASIRAAVRLPLRVMLRGNGGFGATAAEIDGLCREAEALRRAGADQFVFGFLDADGALDRAALDALIAAVAPCPWTLHHAFDHAADARASWEIARTLPGIDCILTGGLRGDVGTGLATLCARADWQIAGPRWLAGGNLALEHLPPLRAAGILQYHVGRTARRDMSWERPVDAGAVRRWREALDQGAGVAGGA
jgi:copper homeostasis protein